MAVSQLTEERGGPPYVELQFGAVILKVDLAYSPAPPALRR